MISDSNNNNNHQQQETGIGQVDGDCCYQLLKSNLCQRKDNLGVAHINVNGILTSNKLDEVKLMLEITRLDLLGVMETKLHQNNSNSELKIDSYQMERNDRGTGGGGGVMLYYKETLDVAPYLVKNIVNNIESIWVDITFHSQRTITGVIYRPPDKQKFYSNLEHYLQNIWKNRKNTMIVVDLNSDLHFNGKPAEECLAGKHLLRVLSKFSMENVIAQPTRITERSRTLLDLMITSRKEQVIRSGKISTGIADHSLTYAVLKLRRNRTPSRFQMTSNVKQCDWEGFRKSLSYVPWSVCNVFDEVDDHEWCWGKIYKDIRNEFIKERKTKARVKSHPWMTSRIRKEINQRYKLLQIAIQTNNQMIGRHTKENEMRLFLF
eukprot:gene14558-16060_t